MKTAFISDSGIGLSVSEAEKYGIYSVPLNITYDNESKLDIEEMSIEGVWQLLAQEKVIKTSLPSAGMIDDLFTKLKQNGYQRLFCICISAGLSSTADTFKLIARQHNLELIHVECYATAFLQRHLIIKAKQLYDNGSSIEEIIQYCNQCIEHSDTFVLPASSTQLIRSGRLTGAAATLAGLFKIKPWLHVNKQSNGKIEALGKGRSHDKIINETINLMQEKVQENYSIFVTHVNDEELAKKVSAKINERFNNVSIIVDKLMAPVAVHTGLGCIAIQYFPSVGNIDESN